MTTRLRSRYLLLALAALAGCDGENQFKQLPTSPTGADGLPPRIELVSPENGRRIAVGDSLRVSIDVRENRALRLLRIEGFVQTGSASQGNQSALPRFQPRVIEFDSTAQVRDTSITVLLPPVQGQTQPASSVLIVATAIDFGGNETSDTVLISLGGPRVNIQAPTSDAAVAAGAPLRVRVTASVSGDAISELRLVSTGAVALERVLVLETPATSVDTTIILNIPAGARGEIDLRLTARTLANEIGESDVVRVRVTEPVADNELPVVSFRMDVASRAEQTDSVSVTVSAIDNSQVDSVGVTVYAIERGLTGTDTVGIVSRSRSGDSGVFRLSFSDLGVAVPQDTSTIRVEVTAFAVDTAGNCAAATVVNTASAEPCSVVGGRRVSNRSGAATDVALLHGITIPVDAGDRIADLASNGTTLFMSNFSKNRVDAVRIGEQTVFGSARVGSQPWGLGLSKDGNALYVANSGGTNISVVAPTALVEVSRIQTPNVKLFLVEFTAETDTTIVVDTLNSGAVDTTVTVEYREVPTSLSGRDYSDRPQYIAQTATGRIFYSTKPTGTAPNGTIRTLTNGRVELFVDYVDRTEEGQVAILGADSVLISTTDPKIIRVHPRGVSTSQIFQGYVNQVREQLAAAGVTSVRFEYFLNVEQLALSDTTFVAVSRDHGTVAFGEGGADPARVILFRETQGGVTRRGDVQDLINNAEERVVGLALNHNGSLGVARGDDAYFFGDDLRLRGIVSAGKPSGGVDMHPTRNLAMVSGITEQGAPFIDVIEAQNFCEVRRFYIRDRVIGAVRAVQTPTGVYLFAVTTSGVVSINLAGLDLSSC